MEYRFYQCFGGKMRKLSRMVDARYKFITKEFGLTESQLTILFFLFAKGEVEQGAIGKKMYLERSTVSRNIGVLVKKNWVLKSADYQPTVQLTKEGKELVQSIIPRWEKLMDDLQESLGYDVLPFLENLEERMK